MPILNVQVNQPGQSGILPGLIFIYTNDTVAEVTTAGYLNKLVAQNLGFNEADMCLVTTKTSPNAASTQVGWYEVSKSGDNWSLVPPGNPGTVILPTIANHIATYTNTTGTLSEDAATAINAGNIQAGLSGTAGYLASFPATAAKGSLRLTATASAGDTVTNITNAAMGQPVTLTIPDPGSTTANMIISKSSGTQQISTGSLQVSAGNITAGASGAAGSFLSYSSTAARGYLGISAVANTGDTPTIISNAEMGQATTVVIPDPANPTGKLLISAGATPFVSGNFPVASGTQGLMVDSGVAATNIQNKTNIKAGTTGNIGGAGAGPITVPVAGVTAASVVTASIATSTNTVSVSKVTPGSGGFDILFSADPGATCTISYIAFIAAQ